jgi:subtilisin family serine protease
MPLGLDEDGKLDDATLRRFVFQTYGRARRTQDSPVMPDVWLQYIKVAEKVAEANTRAQSGQEGTQAEDVDLLLTPWSGVSPGMILARLQESMGATGPRPAPAAYQGAQRTRTRMALSGTRVVICANFNTLVCHIVPLSSWWIDRFKDDAEYDTTFDHIVRDLDKPRGTDAEFARYFALVGFIDCLLNADSPEVIGRLGALAHWLGSPDLEDREAQSRNVQTLQDIYQRAGRLLWHAVSPAVPVTDKETAEGATPGIFIISLNRTATQSLYESRATTKADAASRVFDIDTTGIAFAVIDGGIDARHPAFLDRSKRETSNLGEEWPDDAFCLKYSRVKATYDFTRLRDLIDFAVTIAPTGETDEPSEAALAALEGHPKQKMLAELYCKNARAFHHLAIRNQNARDLDWEIVRPLIAIQHDIATYDPPKTDHGTHVAGILAAYLPRRRQGKGADRELCGMCRHLTLYDLRVFDEKGASEEYTIVCALEFVGWMNKDRTNPVVHGANLSLALAHDVDSFACGQTPICEVCNYLVGAGTVVVAAAGNTGFENGAGPQARSMGTGYRAISITDPGNADYVITVGSTHRRDPHLYGVSYFSARGPTGDGRRKPDILAPGEKITSTIPGREMQRMDGTSMAAPHVSGAAAMLMGRYPELIGRPQRVKQILMDSATDLKREPNFQGAGLVDVLRALQSV